MAEIPDKIKQTIENYLLALEQNDIPVQEPILFGSYASGNYHELSDIDLAIVSNKFKGDWFDDQDTIRPITVTVSCDLEVLPYSPADFNTGDPFVKEITRTGIRIA